MGERAIVPLLQGKAANLSRLFTPEAKESVEMMCEFEQPFIADSSKFEQPFGMKVTSLKEAIRETVAWYQHHPHK